MNRSIEIKRYCPQEQEAWDDAVKTSANGTFLFLRNYMEYHAHRFEDFSLMIYDRGKLIALLPASKHNDIVISHGGLTYGALITAATVSSLQIQYIVESIAHYLRNEGLKQWHYKPTPHIYHSYPHEAELYALSRLGAIRTACSLASVIDLESPLRYAELRRRCIKRAQQQHITIGLSNDFAPFWEILTHNLQERHQVNPVHTLQEIELLYNRFPHQITLHTATLQGEVVAGCVIYDTGRVAHAQYIAASPAGKSCGALDLLFAHLIEKEYRHCRYFDFGISTEQGGKILNEGLLAQKEGFGARGIIYETYTIAL